MSLFVRMLGSSSAGNCTVLWTSRGAVLVDFGFPLGTIRQRLRETGIGWTDLRAAFITHAHGDHVNLPVLARLLASAVPVFCPAGIADHLRKKRSGQSRRPDREVRSIAPGEVVRIGDLGVTAFEVPHDSPGGCCGYCITHPLRSRVGKIVLATDMGYATRGAASMLADADVMIIESNHDVGMLNRSGRPPALIRRIRSLGHLSNDQCGDLLLTALSLADRRPQAIILAHLSRECNDPDLAVQSTLACLRSSGFAGIPVHPALPDGPGDVITIC